MNYKGFGKWCWVYKSFFLDNKESLRRVSLCVQAKIHPEQPATILSTDDCKHLRAAIHEVHTVFTLDSFFSYVAACGSFTTGVSRSTGARESSWSGCRQWPLSWELDLPSALAQEAWQVGW